MSTENAFKECNERKGGSSTEALVVIGVVGLLGGYFLGKGLK